MPDLRPVRAGETRVLGVFESVGCGQDQVVLRVITDRGPVHLEAKAFSDIEFISYRPDPPKSVACGPAERTLRVLATYRPFEARSPAGIDGYAVAVELIPDNYTPR